MITTGLEREVTVETAHLEQCPFCKEQPKIFIEDESKVTTLEHICTFVNYKSQTHYDNALASVAAWNTGVATAAANLKDREVVIEL